MSRLVRDRKHVNVSDPDQISSSACGFLAIRIKTRSASTNSSSVQGSTGLPRYYPIVAAFADLKIGPDRWRWLPSMARIQVDASTFNELFE